MFPESLTSVPGRHQKNIAYADLDQWRHKSMNRLNYLELCSEVWQRRNDDA